MNKLQVKLRDNQLLQRRCELLNSAPAHLSLKLEAGEVILSQKIQQLLNSWYWPSPILPNEALPIQNNQNRPVTWECFEFDNTDALNRQMGLIKLPEQEAYCWLGIDAPIIKINSKNWNHHAYHFIQLIHQSECLCFALVTEDNARGILLREYIGYLDKSKRTNHSEIVYELASW